MEKGNHNKRPALGLSAKESSCKRPRAGTSHDFLLGCCRHNCVRSCSSELNEDGHGHLDELQLASHEDEKEKYYLLGRLAEIEAVNEIIDGKDNHRELNEDGHGFGYINLDEQQLAAHEGEKEKYYLLGRLAEIEAVNETIDDEDDHSESNEAGHGSGNINLGVQQLAAREDEKEKYYLLGRLAEIKVVNEIIDGENDYGFEDEQQLTRHELENETCYLLGRLAELEVVKEIVDWMLDPNVCDHEDDIVDTDVDSITDVHT